MMMTWPFATGDATLAQAAAFIAQVARRENEGDDASKRRVRDRIRKAATRKRKARFDVPRDSSARVGESFWQWASNEWPLLKNIPGFPPAPINRVIGSCGLGAFGCSGAIIAAPTDRNELERAYFEMHATIWRQSSEIAHSDWENTELKAKLKAAEAELQAKCDREDEINRKKGRRSPQN